MLLSIDVGIKNLAMCLMDDTKIVQWIVDGVPPESSDGLFISMRNLLDSKPWILEADTILIEKQPEKNKKMKTVENFLHTYMIIKNPNAETIIYDARHKIPDVSGSGKALYRKRKQTSITRCREFICETNTDLVEYFDKSKKKDDLADTVMQGLSFIRRKPEVSKSKKKVTVRPRKPTENQKNTRYSKSNLLWILRNTPSPSTNKRFMKDLKRYYNSITELESEAA